MSSLLNIWNNGPVDDFSNRKRVMRDTATEFLATTLFIYLGTLGAISTGAKLVGQGSIEDVGRILPIAICFGVSILGLVHSIGHITGGHMNPGVSLLMYFRRQMSGKKMLCYWLAQFTASLLASSLVWGSSSGMTGINKANGSEVARPPLQLGSTTLSDDITTGNGFLLEFMGSFCFYFVIAQCALDKRGIALTSFPAIPIGLILVVVHVCLIPFTGCGVNPARTFGPSMVTCMAGDCDLVVDSWYWIYYIGPFLASFAVAEVTMMLEMDVEESSGKAEEEDLKANPTAEEVLEEAQEPDKSASA